MNLRFSLALINLPVASCGPIITPLFRSLADLIMRAAFTIEPELLRLLEVRAARQGRTLDEVLNNTLRQVLRNEPLECPQRFEVSTFASALMPGVDVAKINRMLDSLPLPASNGPA